MSDGIRAANLGLRFLLEMCALAALLYWGARTGQGPAARLALALGAPVAAAVVWGAFVAPRAPWRPGGVLRAVIELRANVAAYRAGVDTGVLDAAVRVGRA